MKQTNMWITTVRSAYGGHGMVGLSAGMSLFNFFSRLLNHAAHFLKGLLKLATLMAHQRRHRLSLNGYVGVQHRWKRASCLTVAYKGEEKKIRPQLASIALPIQRLGKFRAGIGR